RHTRSTRDWSSDVCSSDLIETLQKNRLHVAGECGRRGRCGHQHFVAAVDQVPRAGLMKRRCELVVDVPAIMDEKSVESRSQQTGSFLVAAAGQDAVDRRVAGDRDPQPPGCPPTFQPDSSMVTLGPIRTWLMRSW